MDKTIGNLNIKIAAETLQFQQELKRADAATAAAASSITGQIEGMLEHLSRSFSATRLAHGLIASFGIGTGAALVETTIKKWEEVIKSEGEAAHKAAEENRALNESFAQLADSVHAAQVAKLSPAAQLSDKNDQLAILKDKIKGVSAELAALQIDMATLVKLKPIDVVALNALAGVGVTSRDKSIASITSGDWEFRANGVGDRITKEQQEVMARLKKFYAEKTALETAIYKDPANVAARGVNAAQQNEAENAASIDAHARHLDLLTMAQDQYRTQIDATWTSLSKTKDIGLQLDAAHVFAFDPDKVGDTSKALAAYEAEAEKMWEAVRSPAEKYAAEIEHINLLVAKVGLDPLTAANAKLAAESAAVKANKSVFMAGFQDPNGPDVEATLAGYKKIEQAQSVWEKESTRVVGLAADQISSTMVDALSGVAGAWSNLGRIIVSEIAKIIIQLTVVAPLIQMLGGFFGYAPMASYGKTTSAGTGSAGGLFADGGDPPVGKLSLVGEAGPELFVPKTSGTIIPNHLLSAAGGTGPSINITQNFQTGMTRQEFVTATPSIIAATKGAVLDAVRRGGAYRAAFA